MKNSRPFKAAVLSAAWVLMAAVLPADGEVYVVGAQSQTALEQILAHNPDNSAAAYLLGKVYIDQGKNDDAIEAWERYVAAAPENDPKLSAVREHLTVLKLRQAAEFARRAARGEIQVSDQDIPENTLAVLNFQADGDDREIAALSKGLTAMIITDLAKVPALKVVERQKMTVLLREIRMGQAGLLDKDAALEGGRMLLARNIVQGDLSLRQQSNLLISSKVMETINAATLGSPEAQGPKPQIFDMEKQLVFGILETMGMKELDEETRKAIKKQHTNSIEALINFGLGLDFFDRQEFGQAKDAFQAALGLDPEFGLAAEALANTPDTVKEIQKYDLEILDYAIPTEDIADLDEAEGGSINLTPIDIVDAAHNQVGLDLRIEDHYGETPGFPDRPDVEEPGRIQIEW